jgi:DNA-binding NarL/FixJ family response regulator
LRESGCKAKVIFVTVHEDQEYIQAAFSAGASGYVLKSRLASDLVSVLQGAMQGQKFTSPAGIGTSAFAD